MINNKKNRKEDVITKFWKEWFTTYELDKPKVIEKLQLERWFNLKDKKPRHELGAQMINLYFQDFAEVIAKYPRLIKGVK